MFFVSSYQASGEADYHFLHDPQTLVWVPKKKWISGSEVPSGTTLSMIEVPFTELRRWLRYRTRKISDPYGVLVFTYRNLSTPNVLVGLAYDHNIERQRHELQEYVQESDSEFTQKRLKLIRSWLYAKSV